MSNRVHHYLDILIVLAAKDFKIRYRNSILGFIWSLLNPLAYMVILTVVFSLLLRNNIPNFPAYLLIGLLVWRFFAIGTSQGLSSIVGNPSLIRKVYIPRQIIVLSSNLANFLGATMEFLVLLPLLIILGVRLTIYAFLIIPLLILEFMLVFGLSLWLSSLNLKYRDFYQLWDIAIQLGFFLSPIVYNSSLIPERFRLAYSLNPVTALIESARSIFLMGQLPSALDVSIALGGVMILLGLGLVTFRWLERRFAEEL